MKSSGRERFYSSRQRITMLLLIWVAGIGLPMTALKPLRQKLSLRVETLREAWNGRSHAIVLARIGENREPFPAEYALPEPPLPALHPQVPAIADFAARNPLETPATRTNPAVRILKIPAPAADIAAAAEPELAASLQAEKAAGMDEHQPGYQQGLREKEALDLLLKTNAVMDRLVQGGDPSLRYESWGALMREEGIYWVRIGFSSATDGSRPEYIWQVNLQSQQVTPLSFNARALAKS